MRIDGFSSPYSLDRSPRPGSAVTPYREAQREAEARQQQPVSPSNTQGFEQTPQQRRVQASNASSDSLPARQQDVAYERQVSNRVAQALASYSSTASFVAESDAQEVLGLDLYA